MNITGLYSIDSVLKELEAALQIDATDFEERDMDVVIANVKQRITRQYHIDLSSGRVDAKELELGVYSNTTALFFDNMAALHAKVCGLAQIERYLTTSQVSLEEVNYLGAEEESLKSFLAVLQRKSTQALAETDMRTIKEKMSLVSKCREKRLFYILIVADAIGLQELVAAIAELLYASMLQ